MTQLKKLAQGFQGQEGAGQLGDIDEDDEVPGETTNVICGVEGLDLPMGGRCMWEYLMWLVGYMLVL